MLFKEESAQKSFLFSIGIHSLIAALALVAWKETPKLTQEEHRISVSLNKTVSNQPKQNKSEPLPTIQPKTPIEHSAIKQPTKSQTIPPAKPVMQTMAPIQQKMEPKPSATPQVQHNSTQAVAAAKPIETTQQQAATKPQTPAAPPINYQKAYQEDNLGKIRGLLSKNLVYPKNARRLNQQGTVTVRFTLTVEGEVKNIEILESSEFDLLDSAARKLIDSTANEFPKPQRNVTITIPIGYKLN